MDAIEVYVNEDGSLQAVYDDRLLPLLEDADHEERRASHVEPLRAGGGWSADMAPVGGPVLGPFATRAAALAAERAWLAERLDEGRL